MSEPAEIQGIRAMWRAVILLALRDAVGLCSGVLSDSPTARARKALARGWFLGAGEDFRLVCELAAFDWRRVRERALKAMEDPEAVRQKLRVGHRVLKEETGTDHVTEEEAEDKGGDFEFAFAFDISADAALTFDEETTEEEPADAAA